MITKERLPSLQRRPPPPRHVLGHTGLADIDAELQKLAMDSRRSPRIVEAHLADQPANFQRHDWSTAAAPRFPAPVRFKSSAVPTDHSVWPDNCQCIIDIGKQSADPSQYQSVNREKWEFLGTSPPQHIELLPQNQNLCLKRSSRPKQIDQHPEDKSAQIHHQASASSDSQSIASRNGFTVGTGFGYRRWSDHTQLRFAGCEVSRRQSRIARRSRNPGSRARKHTMHPHKHRDCSSLLSG
jgi:hypothetical protein